MVNEYAVCTQCGQEWVGRQDPELRDSVLRNFGRYWEAKTIHGRQLPDLRTVADA